MKGQTEKRRYGIMQVAESNKSVVGFAFSENADSVLLVRKLRPEWQKGFLNGIGGKIEIGETHFDAINRECIEETGLSIDWIYRGIMKGINNDGKSFVCHIFYAYSQDIFEYEQREDETLKIYNPIELDSEQIIMNLNFLIPFGMYGEFSVFITLGYRTDTVPATELECICGTTAGISRCPEHGYTGGFKGAGE